MEKISIQNFAGIKEMDFEFKSINILIGPQGSGKSVTVKLHYFFRSFFQEFRRSILSNEPIGSLWNKQEEKFIKFFPKDTWPEGNFKITYLLDEIQMSIAKSVDQIKFDYSENISVAFTRLNKVFLEEKKKYGMKYLLSLADIDIMLKEELGDVSIYNQFFIPAGRSFFANVQSKIFSLLSINSSIDPFLIEFGAFYEDLKFAFDSFDSISKEFDEITTEILNGDFVREFEKDYLVHKDKRKVSLANASSGQQETLPLIIILKALSNAEFSSGRANIYIEEPEAHLFPNAQKAIVQLLARVFNNGISSYQIFVTTHSPYILSSFNNLLEAGRLNSLMPEKAKDIAGVIPVVEQLDPGVLAAYSLNNGVVENLIDQETNLITQTVLDSISNDIAIEFGKLLDIEF